jgi:hypothetical protein
VFFEITKGERAAPGDWLTFVREQKTAQPQPDARNGQPEKRTESSLEDTQPMMTFQTAGAD